MKIKTSELKDAALDWAVAVARGCEEIKVYSPWRPTDRGWVEVRFNPDPRVCTSRFDPSDNWLFAGTIIDQEEITIDYRDNETKARKWSDQINDFIEARAGKRQGCLAAMRCYVASKLGDEVDVPEDLVK